ncbi:MATE family efflux transporter [Pontibacter saemangeumensis]|uniref:MATE family efflux transporter n=1 Tax=Pontibacter saemangeumensis TaxID=1084525 RepID=A0ABP8LXE2_9BACT
MQAAKRVAVNTGILYARMAVTVLISLYTTRLILEALGAKDFGIFNLVGGTIAMLGFLNAAMAGATQRFMSYAEGAGNTDQSKHIFNVSLVLHLLIAALLIVVLEIAGYIFFNGVLTIPADRVEAAKLVYHFMVVSTIFTVFSVPYDAVINAHENMLLFAILGIVESVMKLLIAFYVIQTTEDKLVVYGVLMAALSIFLLLLRVFYCQKKYPECKISIRENYDKKLMKEMTSFAGWSFMGSSTSMISAYGQGIVLNVFFGTVVNAAQGIASQVSGQLGAFAATMLRALNPVIAKSEGGGDRKLMLRASIMGSKISFFLWTFFCVPVLIEMPYVLNLWLKDVPDYAVVFCRLYLIRILIDQLYVTLSSSIMAVGNIRKYETYNSLLTILPLPVAYILFLNGYPAYTIYVVFIVYSVFSFALNLYFANRICGLEIADYLNRVALRCSLSFAFIFIFSLVPFYIMPAGTLRLFETVLCSSATFLLSLYLIGFNKEERRPFNHLFLLILQKIGIVKSDSIIK